MEVIIIAKGDLKNLNFLKDLINDNTYVICADGAAKYLVPLRIVPNLLVGDLDSITAEDLNWMKDQGVEFKKYPIRKDFTDSELAVEYALELHPHRITVVGGIGSRWDHSIGNIMLLFKIHRRGFKARLMDDTNELTITDGNLQIEGQPGDLLSVIPLTSRVKGVTLGGLEYPLNQHDFEMGSTLGISNQFIGDTARVSLEEGILLVCKSKDN